MQSCSNQSSATRSWCFRSLMGGYFSPKNIALQHSIMLDLEVTKWSIKGRMRENDVVARGVHVWSISNSYRPLIPGCVRVTPPLLSLLWLHISEFIAGLLVFLWPSSKNYSIHPSMIHCHTHGRDLTTHNHRKLRCGCGCACALESEW